MYGPHQEYWKDYIWRDKDDPGLFWVQCPECDCVQLDGGPGTMCEECDCVLPTVPRGKESELEVEGEV